MPYVYETTNLVNNKRYMGVSSKTPDTSLNYYGSGQQLNKAIKKYGKENFTKTILKEFETVDAARKYEEYLIEYRDVINNIEYYNLTKGGHGGFSENAINSKNSDITKRKISNTLNGRKRPAEVIEKISAKNRGRKWATEIVEKRRVGMLQYYKTRSIDVANATNKKISESSKGKKLTAVTKDKLGKMNAKYSDELTLHVKQLINNKVSYSNITKQFGIGAETLTRIKQETSYKWLWR